MTGSSYVLHFPHITWTEPDLSLKQHNSYVISHVLCIPPFWHKTYFFILTYVMSLFLPYIKIYLPYFENNTTVLRRRQMFKTRLYFHITPPQNNMACSLRNINSSILIWYKRKTTRVKIKRFHITAKPSYNLILRLHDRFSTLHEFHITYVSNVSVA